MNKNADADYTSKAFETSVKEGLQTARSKLTPAGKAKFTNRLNFYKRLAKKDPDSVGGLLAIYDLDEFLPKDAKPLGRDTGLVEPSFTGKPTKKLRP